MEFLEEARRDLARYESVALKVARVTDIRPVEEGFSFVCSDGSAGSASIVLLATGLADELPELAGVDGLYGVSVHHCLYCDGFEHVGKRVAAYGKGDKGADLAIMMKHWTPDVVALSDGTEVSADAMRKAGAVRHKAAARTRPRAGRGGRAVKKHQVRKRAGS
jgi:thioredoxin reductase